MFLKSLTMRGFKSFADRTVLEFEPGITVVVGPNGSGKSNVVDALTWVLGTRSPKLLRGGELSDVIFAGSPGRPALARAFVEIVIDNSAGQLGTAGLGPGGSAQQFSEVRISREIFATGESRYAINGVECRLLDVHELLSDTGVGRELHTIVGQGQLDAVLHAKPEERRAFVEEAAGILKHRQRRERAQRKLEQVDVHIDKLRSILKELRRQLRPLERQAEAANRHAVLQAELRDVQLRLAAHDLQRLQAAASAIASEEQEAAGRLRELETGVVELEARAEALEAEARAEAPRAEQARLDSERLGRLRERLRGTADLIEARRRHLVEYVEEPLAGRPPDELRAQAERLDDERERRGRARVEAQGALDAAAALSRDAQLARREHDRRLAAAARARAEARDQHTRWEAEVRTRRAALTASTAEARRLEAHLADLDARGANLDAQFEHFQDEIRRLDAEEWRLTEALEGAQRAAADAEAALDAAVARERELERQRASQLARAEALLSALAQAAEGSSALLASDLQGLLGLLAEHVRVRPGGEAAVSAALGPLAEAVVARSPADAHRAVEELRALDVGRAVILPLDGTGAPMASAAAAPAEAVPANVSAPPLSSLLEAARGRSPQVLDSLSRALASHHVAGSWEEALRLHAAHPDRTFVTLEGDLVGPFGFAGGSAPERSAVVTAAAARDAERSAEELAEEIQDTLREVEAARVALSDRRAELEEAGRGINESDARITTAAEGLARVNQERQELERQRDRVRAQQEELASAELRHERDLETLEAAPPAPPDEDPRHDEPDHEADRLDVEMERSRAAEVEARLVVERLDEQIQHLTATVRDLRREAAEVERALADAARRREQRRRHLGRCVQLAGICAQTLAALELAIADADADRDRLQEARTRRDAEAGALRAELRRLGGDLDAVREERHGAALRGAELRHDLEQLVHRLRADFGLSPEESLAEHPDASGYDRVELATTEEGLARKLETLGRVNPLALEEFHALEERHKFLSRQLQDLSASKRDLLEVIAAVDDKIREVFAEAFADVAREFEQVFATMFPGGEGRLILLDSGDLLTAGIEVEARPPGKRVRRLSLLSGGERSLTAMALLFAIFRARPSPFYVLDEVEAALDDVNLQRLLQVVESFKERSQLILVTHQKRTMEVADVLYGVTMGKDAVSKVVAERMSEAASA